MEFPHRESYPLESLEATWNQTSSGLRPRDVTAFGNFRSHISSAALAAVADHWEAASASDLAPSWRDIDPIAIYRHLPIVAAWRWDPELEDFVGRLAGDEIEQALGSSIRGRTLLQIHGPDTASQLRALFLNAMWMPNLVHWIGEIQSLTGEPGFGERILMPLAACGDGAPGVLAAAEYRIGWHPILRPIRPNFGQGFRRTFPLAST